MNTFMNHAAGVAALALAALPLVALPFAAHAQDQAFRVTVGNLSEPSQAAGFGRDVDAIASRLCVDDSRDLRARRDMAACKAAVHAEAESQLSHDQRLQLAHAGPSSTLMGRSGQ